MPTIAGIYWLVWIYVMLQALQFGYGMLWDLGILSK